MTTPAPPSYLRRRENVADTGLTRSRDFAVISLRGREFTAIDLDGTEQSLGNTIDIIVVDSLPNVGRKYYAGAYDPEVPSLPDCWSNDGQTPAKNATTPQAASCASCQFGAAGSGRDGKSTACGHIKPLIVYLASDTAPRPVLYRLDCKAQTLFGGKQSVGYLPWLGSKESPGYVRNLYNDTMQGLPADQRHFSLAVTRVAFTKDSVPSVGFKFVGWVEPQDIEFMDSVSVEDYVPMLEVTSKGEAAASAVQKLGKEKQAALPAPGPQARRTAEPRQEQEQEQEAPVRRRSAPARAEPEAPVSRRAARAEPEPEAPVSRRAARGSQEVLEPEQEAPASRRGRPAVPSKITPAVVSGDDDDPEVAELARRLGGM